MFEKTASKNYKVTPVMLNWALSKETAKRVRMLIQSLLFTGVWRMDVKVSSRALDWSEGVGMCAHAYAALHGAGEVDWLVSGFFAQL